MPRHDIVVIGASAGGVEALRELASLLHADLPAAIFVTVHIPANAPSVLPAILSRRGLLPALTATDGVEIRPGRIYIAPPDHHLLIHPSGLTVGVARGPRENGHRPAIDPLFRTAAVACGARVVGVVLSGTLDDGTAGLAAVKRHGGIAVVQDPEEALYGDMPRSALAHVRVDHVCKIAELAPLLMRLAREETRGAAGPAAPPESVDRMEADMSRMDPAAMHEHQRPGNPSGFGCPECGGSLFELDDGGMIRFRCRVGHAYAPESLLSAQADSVEAALWGGLRALEENAALCARLAERLGARGSTETGARYAQRADQATAHAETLRKLLLGGHGEGAGGNGAAQPHALRDGGHPAVVGG